jgi:uroporphyrin-III C-methyltransferase
MKDLTYGAEARPAPLLVAHDEASHVHLIIGSNPLAAARCTKSLEVGANPIVIAPVDGEMHYLLSRRIAEGIVKWIPREFQEADLRTFGREEVENVVDAVFVTIAGVTALSM